MKPPQSTTDLFPESTTPHGLTLIGPHSALIARGPRRIVTAHGLPVASWQDGDRAAEAWAMVQLVEHRFARQVEVATAFSCTTRTVRRHQQRLATGGLAALGRPPGYPAGQPRRLPNRDKTVAQLHAKGLLNREIARHLAVDEKTVRKACRRLGLLDPAPQVQPLDLGLDLAAGADSNLSSVSPTPAPAQLILPAESAGAADPNLSAPPSASLSGAPPAPDRPATADLDPSDRTFDRLLAYLGAIDDAVPLFGTADRVAGAGVLLAVPALCATGVFDCATRAFGTLGPAFYGLRTTMMTLLVMALLRIRRPEGLKERCPRELGKVLGLDRAPEVKTLRKKLKKLAAKGASAAFGQALLRERVRQHGQALAFLYVDGHVRVYHGKERLSKAHVTQMRIALPATTDYWLGDQDGEPLLVLTAEANAGLIAVLPDLLARVRPLLGERRATVVFDRGGWSAKLFKVLYEGGLDVLTYRKGKTVPVPVEHFAWFEATLDGQPVRYRLADQEIDLPVRGDKPMKMRQVTRLSDDGAHQTPIVTTRTDLPAIEVAWRMFARWRQENFFKYMGDEFALDALTEYGSEPADVARLVPNPARKPIDAELSKLNKEINSLDAEAILRAYLDPAKPRAEAVEQAAAALLAKMRRRIELRAKRADMPERVPVGSLADGPVVQLKTEQKHLTNLLKMVAYQAESALLRTIAPHYSRSDDEGRTLVQNILAAPAGLEVRGGELHVQISALSSGHRSRVAAVLCADMDRKAVVFPGTRLRMRFAADGADGVEPDNLARA